MYLAEDHPQPGEHLPTKLFSAMKASVGFVVLLTEDSAKSILVQEEIGAAGSIGLPVVAVAAPGVATDSKKLGLLAGQELTVVDPATLHRRFLTSKAGSRSCLWKLLMLHRRHKCQYPHLSHSGLVDFLEPRG